MQMIIEFLLGVFAGTIFGLLIVKRSGSRTQPRTTPSVRVKSAIRTTSKSASQKVSIARPREKPVRVEKPKVEPATRSFPIEENRTSVQSCPTCGLEAPESLMTEHFLGSPSHRYKPAKLQPIAAVSAPVKGAASPSVAEDSTDSVRTLLQMLVPPRAFGRRHSLTTDPILTLIPTGSSRRNP